MRSCRFWARTVDMLVMPSTKQMASRMLDLPEPLRPVIELKLSSLWCPLSALHGLTWTRLDSILVPSRDHGSHGIRLEALSQLSARSCRECQHDTYVNN